MNIALVLYVVGTVMCSEAALMLIPVLVAVVTGVGDWIYFIYTVIPLFIIGFALRIRKPKVGKMQAKDGLAAVGLAWIAMAAFGALPFYFSGYFGGYVNCFFETVSGFTTTGATILTDIEGLKNGGLMFWRSFTHWIGGMGILVFVLAVMPNMDGSNIQLLRAESPGPTPGKMAPKLRETARILYLIYFGLTVAEVIALLITGMPLYDSFIHAMGTAGTGGFSNMNESVGAYGNAAAEWVIAIFMMLFGVNFSVHYMALRGKIKSVLKNEEFRLYICILLAATILLTVGIAGEFYSDSLPDAIRTAFFQATSIATTTGFTTANFDIWPAFCRQILVLLMIIGACAGSTGGGIKVSRLLTLFKAIKQEVRHMLHPRRIQSARMDGEIIEDSVIRGVLVFFATYIIIALLAMIVIAFDGFDVQTNITAVLSALGNIGPGLGSVGPTGNFAGFSVLSKLVLSFCMLAGRLEIFPVLILFVPSTWKKID